MVSAQAVLDQARQRERTCLDLLGAGHVEASDLADAQRLVRDVESLTAAAEQDGDS